jgi:hypothetical protein
MNRFDLFQVFDVSRIPSEERPRIYNLVEAGSVEVNRRVHSEHSNYVLLGGTKRREGNTSSTSTAVE